MTVPYPTCSHVNEHGPVSFISDRPHPTIRGTAFYCDSNHFARAVSMHSAGTRETNGAPKFPFLIFLALGFYFVSLKTV